MDFYKAAIVCEFQTVAHEILNDLRESASITEHFLKNESFGYFEGKLQFDVFVFCLERHDSKSRSQNIIHVEIIIVEHELGGLKLRLIEKVIDQASDVVGGRDALANVNVHQNIYFLEFVKLLEQKFG